MQRIVLALIIALLGLQIAFAQDSTTVPDVTGLNVPQAAAALNRAGLGLGAQTNLLWTAESGLPQNTISVQSVAAGANVAVGTVVDVTVLRSPNVTLLYDDNDLTLINRAGVDLDLTGLIFSTVESSRAASFSVTRWGMNFVGASDCLQVWSISRSNAKEVEGCRSMNWLTTNRTEEHFWTALNGVTTFNVAQSGVERIVCPAAPAGTQPISCDFYLPAAGGDVTPFIAFAYNNDVLVIHNRSEDRWMPLAGILVGGQSIGEPAMYVMQNTVANVSQLAPGQCVLFSSAADAQPPVECDVIASTPIYFWNAPFVIDGVTDEVQRNCPAATAGRLTLCILPR
jgi:hypothetical protein